MDHEVARTLEDLERKLVELERTLRGISERREPLAQTPPPELERQPAYTEARDEQLEQPGAAAPLADSPGRIIDERLEAGSHRTPLAPEPSYEPPAAPEPPYEPPAAPEPSYEPPAAAEPSYEPPLAAFPSAPEPRGVPVQPPDAPQGALLRPAAAPDPARLLRFRERLERTSPALTHEYDELLGRISYPAVSTAATSTISFARGAPSLDIVDVDGLQAAAARAFDSDPQGTTAYGTSIGYPRLRSWIADRHGVAPERVLVTNGSMQADAFLFEHLVRPGDDVIVERPTYDRTLLSLRQRGARLYAIELQPDGIDTGALARLLDDGGARPALAHIIPNFQNPAGYTLSGTKRRDLLELAARHGFVVFEDDPYVALRFSGEEQPTMLSMDPERVVYASSFSKTVCPGIRVGYLVGPEDMIGAIAKLATNTYISPSMVSQSIVYEFCASGAIERSIETVKAALAERASTLAEALRRELPEAQFVEPQGGYFMWVTLPSGTDIEALFTAAAARGVSFVKGTDFLLEGGHNTLRLAYSGVTPGEIDAGIARLADAYRSL